MRSSTADGISVRRSGGRSPRADQVVAVERGVEDADRHLDAGDLAQVLGELARERHAAVRDADEVEAVEVLVALDDLVGDAHQGAADADVVEDDALSRRARLGARRGALDLGGSRSPPRSLCPPRGTDLKGRRTRSRRRIPARPARARQSAGRRALPRGQAARPSRRCGPSACVGREVVDPGQRVQQREPAPVQVPRPVEEAGRAPRSRASRTRAPDRGCRWSCRGCRRGRSSGPARPSWARDLDLRNARVVEHRDGGTSPSVSSSTSSTRPCGSRERLAGALAAGIGLAVHVDARRARTSIGLAGQPDEALDELLGRQLRAQVGRVDRAAPSRASWNTTTSPRCGLALARAGAVA